MGTNQSDNLRPCPFCGGTKIRTIEGRAYCVDCGLNVAFALIGKWNTRPIEDKLQAEIDRLKSERLRWTKGGNGSHWDGCEEVHWDCKIVKLQAEISRLKAERRWIPVNLSPAKDGEYWVCVENITWGSYRERRTFSVSYGWLDVHPPEHVTHWMPLPPPPEEE